MGYYEFRSNNKIIYGWPGLGPFSKEAEKP